MGATCWCPASGHRCFPRSPCCKLASHQSLQIINKTHAPLHIYMLPLYSTLHTYIHINHIHSKSSLCIVTPRTDWLNCGTTGLLYCLPLEVGVHRRHAGAPSCPKHPSTIVFLINLTAVMTLHDLSVVRSLWPPLGRWCNIDQPFHMYTTSQRRICFMHLAPWGPILILVSAGYYVIMGTARYVRTLYG